MFPGFIQVHRMDSLFRNRHRMESFYLPMFMHMMMHLYGGSASLIVASIQGIWN